MNGGHDNFSWTDERVAELKRLWNEGHSAGQIAVMWGVTRNTIIGKVQRVFRKGEAPPRKPGPQIPRRSPVERQRTAEQVSVSHPKKMASVAPARLLAAKPRAAVPAVAMVGILDVTGCKWPTHEDRTLIGGHAFCNAPKGKEAKYCDKHIKAAGEQYRVWTAAEDNAIRAQFNGGRGRDGLAFTLKRTKHAVTIRARQLGLVA